MGWGVMSFHQKLFSQPKILKGFIFRGPFVWIWKRQRQVVAYLGAWKPPKLASFTFFKIWAIIGPCSDWIPLRFPIFKTFLSSNSELPHKVITCFFHTISAEISQFYSFGLLRISSVTYVEASLRTMTRFPIWCFFFFPSPSGGLKADDHRLNPAAVEPGWCRLLRCGLKHRARGTMGPEWRFSHGRLISLRWLAHLEDKTRKLCFILQKYLLHIFIFTRF